MDKNWWELGTFVALALFGAAQCAWAIRDERRRPPRLPVGTWKQAIELRMTGNRHR